MITEKIYNKTAKGRAKLRTTDEGFLLAKAKILALIDGKQSLAVFTDPMTDLDRANFLSLINEFESQGLIHLPGNDIEFDLPTPMVEVTELGPEASVRAWAEATRGSRELHEHGFYANPERVEPAAIKKCAQRLRVLVVDDDESIVELLTLLLQDKGHVVTSATDAMGAVAELRKPVAPDLVLLDVLLPGRNGFDILASIRANERLSKLPVIMVTGMIDSEHVMKGLKLGADGYIFKPFKWPTLYECIQAVTGR